MAKIFKVPFAVEGDKLSPPNAVQSDGSVSYALGYGFDYQRDTGLNEEGSPIDPLAKVFPREQHNGILNDITEALWEIQRFGFPAWSVDATPYAFRAMVRYGDNIWTSLQANNNTIPNEGASWASLPSRLYSQQQIDEKLGLKSDRATTYNSTEVNSLLSFKAPTNNPSFTGVPVAPTAPAGTATNQLATTAFVSGEILGIDPWVAQPIGVPIPIFYHISSDSVPPRNRSYRYISLTANDTYNAGSLTGEVVSGSFPLVSARAVISFPGSPLNGRTINLINTEQRVLRGTLVPGQLLQDSLQNITGSISGASASGASGALSFNRIGAAATYDGANNYGTVNLDASAVARTSSETRAKSIGVVYFMRIK